MIAAGAIGTTCDLVYGYLIECAQFTNNTATTNNNNDNDNDTTPNINSNSKSNEKYFK